MRNPISKLLSLRPYDTECALPSSDVADCKPRQLQGRSAYAFPLYGRLFDHPKSVSHFQVLVKHLGPVLHFPSLLLLLSLPLIPLLLFVLHFAMQLDYEYLAYAVGRQLEGRPVEQCLDLPEKYWMRIPKCWDYDYPAEDKPPGLGGVSRTDV